MIRGDKVLTGILSHKDGIVEKGAKGCFTTDRDKALACRFFYHGHLVGKRYDVCLSALNKEFFISETVISQLLMKQQTLLKQLRSNNTTANDLQKQYPYFDWKV